MLLVDGCIALMSRDPLVQEMERRNTREIAPIFMAYHHDTREILACAT